MIKNWEMELEIAKTNFPVVLENHERCAIKKEI